MNIGDIKGDYGNFGIRIPDKLFDTIRVIQPAILRTVESFLLARAGVFIQVIVAVQIILPQQFVDSFAAGTAEVLIVKTTPSASQSSPQ
jgi:hypothetical protein